MTTMTCPSCGTALDNHDCLDGDAKPSHGDVSFCVSCGVVNLYEDREGTLTLRTASSDDLAEIASAMPEFTIILEKFRRMMALKLAGKWG